MKELFYRYNPWWEGTFALPRIYKRKKYLGQLEKKIDQKEVSFLTGLRRIGKTTLLKLIIQHLLNVLKIDPKKIFYISMDDYLLRQQNISEIIDEYRKIHKILFEEKVYLFLDEITYQNDFEQQLKNVFDNQNVKIFASSSSASLLKSKKPYLTGRSSTIEILPLNFPEYLEFKNIHIKQSDKHLIDGYFEDFLQVGGIPQFVIEQNIEYLSELVSDIIFKDIVALNGIKNPQILKDFFLLLMERAGKQFSINKVSHILGISPDTGKRYFEMFENSYLIYSIPRHGKTNERLLSPKKIYAADLGIRTLFTGFRDKGSLFENYVYLLIKEQNPRYLYENSLEIDFFTENKTLIEVKYNREIEGKQKELFDSQPANKKLLIKSIADLEKL